MPAPEDPRWQRLLSARKAAEPTVDEQASPPPGFVTRVSALAAASRREESLRLWRRWSLYGAAGSACLFLVAVAYTALTRDASPLLPVPTIELPGDL